MIIIGIDPGLTGALSFIDSVSGEVSIAEIPTTVRVTVASKSSKNAAKKKSKKTGGEVKRRVDGLALARLVRERVPVDREAMSVCESVRSFGRSDGARSSTTDSLQRTLGAIEAVFDVLRWPCMLVEPQAWQAHYGLVGKKNEERERGAMPAAITTAVQLYPQAAAELRRVKDHNRAESLLIAHYGRTVLA